MDNLTHCLSNLVEKMDHMSEGEQTGSDGTSNHISATVQQFSVKISDDELTVNNIYVDSLWVYRQHPYCSPILALN